jgi:hypothetical protein
VTGRASCCCELLRGRWHIYSCFCALGSSVRGGPEGRARGTRRRGAAKNNNNKKKIFCRFATLRHGDTSVPDGLSR